MLAGWHPSPGRAPGALRWALAAALCASASGADAEPAKPSPADPLVAQAAAAQAAGDFTAAQDLFARAVIADPASESARRGLAEVQALAAGKAAPGAAVDARTLRGQIALAESREAIEKAEMLARAGHADVARVQLDRARALLAPMVADPAAAAELARVDALTGDAGKAESAATEAAQAETRVEDRDRAQIVRGVEQRRVELAFDERLARLAELRRHEAYEEALAQARALVVDYPGEPRAEKQFEEILALVHDQRGGDLKERDRWLRDAVRERIHDSLIPDGFDARPQYPLDWAVRTRDRGIAAADIAQPDWYTRIDGKLDQRLTFRFEDTALTEALNFLAAQGGFNLVIDPQLIAQGERTVTLAADDMRIRSALSWLTRIAGTSWTLSKQAVYVGPDPERSSVTKEYDVANLVFQPRDMPGKTLSFKGGGGKGGSGFDLFASAGPDAKAMAPEDFVDLIQQAVSPESWKQDGAAITIRGSTLYVTAPLAVQQLVHEFLQNETNSRQVVVHVSARWLTIDDGFLEEVGVDWGRADSLLSPNGGQAVPGYTYTSGQQNFTGNLLNVLPDSAVLPNPAIPGSGGYLSVLRLGRTQVSAMLHALERKQGGRILASPSITTLNGVRGSVFVGDQVAYIADYTVVNDNLDPTIQVLNVGAALDIKPYVSADGKYVTMEFRPAIASYSIFTDVINTFGVIASGANGGGVVVGRGFPIELPNVALAETSTTIMVPDHGVLLVGGFGHHIDEQSSAKAPVLGHIPYLGRLFGRRGRYSARSQLYLLATVDIINYDEAEAKQ